MKSHPNVYTPETLADRWQCSPRHVRNMIRDGRLPGFRLGGKLLRIRAGDVEEFEQCQNGDSDAIEASSQPSQDQAPAAADIRLERIERKLRDRLKLDDGADS